MLKSDLPVVIIHRTYKDYLKVNLEITGINNKIYLIGDSSIEHLGNLNNVTFININKYENIPLIVKSLKNFVNYSSNPKNFEWICFERVFILKFFMEEYKLESVFHIDSDNILLDNVNNFEFNKKIAYIVNKNFSEYSMCSSIHCGLLNQEFCEKFIELYNDLYINKSKFYLIKDKINYHSRNGVLGGICDMTLYYLLEKKKMIEVQNLLTPINGKVFINHINNGQGKESEEQFTLNKNNKIDIKNVNGKYIIYDKINKQNLQLNNIHFQGGAKKLIAEFKTHYLNRYMSLYFPESQSILIS